MISQSVPSALPSRVGVAPLGSGTQLRYRASVNWRPLIVVMTPASALLVSSERSFIASCQYRVPVLAWTLPRAGLFAATASTSVPSSPSTGRPARSAEQKDCLATERNNCTDARGVPPPALESRAAPATDTRHTAPPGTG